MYSHGIVTIGQKTLKRKHFLNINWCFYKCKNLCVFFSSKTLFKSTNSVGFQCTPEEHLSNNVLTSKFSFTFHFELKCIFTSFFRKHIFIRENSMFRLVENYYDMKIWLYELHTFTPYHHINITLIKYAWKCLSKCWQKHTIFVYVFLIVLDPSTDSAPSL